MIQKELIQTILNEIEKRMKKTKELIDSFKSDYNEGRYECLRQIKDLILRISTEEEQKGNVQ